MGRLKTHEERQRKIMANKEAKRNAKLHLNRVKNELKGGNNERQSIITQTAPAEVSNQITSGNNPGSAQE